MLDLTFRPITIWPGTMTRNRQRARFRAPYGDTLKLLDRELRHLLAKQIVLQVALTETDIRLDGRPRAGSKPRHPGVILAFQSRHGPLSYPCDTYSSWEDNLRAIALALEHLRAVDRYGVTRRGEQYQGWTRLPGPIVTPPPMSGEQAARVIATHAADLSLFPDPTDRLLAGEVGAKSVLASAEVFRTLYRQAVRQSHPDTGGSAQAFGEVQQAKEVLERYFAQQ